jgi:tRNA pseudouridine38-40 synthase
VAGEILAAIQTTLGESPKLIGAGRTDHGVHAEGQVANFFTTSREPPPAIADGLNRALAADIHVLQAADAPLSFHARHDAVARRYRYQLASRRSAFFKKLIWWVRRPLEMEPMRQAVQVLRDRRDFSSFADRVEEIREPRVRIYHAGLHRTDFLTTFTIEADHFLPRMVRRIVGVLVQIGTRQIPPEAMERYLQEPADDPARWTAPPSGLFLERVTYDAAGLRRPGSADRTAASGRGSPGSA